MSHARISLSHTIRARFFPHDVARGPQRRLYANIHDVASQTQRDELLIMAQRAEAS